MKRFLPELRGFDRHNWSKMVKGVVFQEPATPADPSRVFPLSSSSGLLSFCLLLRATRSARFLPLFGSSPRVLWTISAAILL